MRRSAEEGAPVEHFLAKPFTMDELIAKVRAMLLEKPEEDAAG
jgi:DNA-binding response OmpR family regulator